MWIEAVEHVLRRIGIRVVGKATSTVQALSLVEEHGPDLLITELEGDDDDRGGITLISRARAAVPDMRSIVLSMSHEAHLIDAAFAAGASAYVVKKAPPEDLASAVRQAFSHYIYLAGRPAVAPIPVAARSSAVNGTRGLTRRELEILRLVAEGHPNAKVAEMLWLTEQTIKFHTSNIYRKLNVANRTEASRWAQVHGLLDVQQAPTHAPALVS